MMIVCRRRQSLRRRARFFLHGGWAGNARVPVCLGYRLIAFAKGCRRRDRNTGTAHRFNSAPLGDGENKPIRCAICLHTYHDSPHNAGSTKPLRTSSHFGTTLYAVVFISTTPPRSIPGASYFSGIWSRKSVVYGESSLNPARETLFPPTLLAA